MVKNASRSGRMSDFIQRELARIIREDYSNPRFGMITVSSVLVTEDLSYARIFISVLDDTKKVIAVDELNHAAGFFRSQIGKKLNTRSVPRFKFVYDDSLVVGSRMEQLLSTVIIPDDTTTDDEDEPNKDTE